MEVVLGSRPAAEVAPLWNQLSRLRASTWAVQKGRPATRLGSEPALVSGESEIGTNFLLFFPFESFAAFGVKVFMWK